MIFIKRILNLSNIDKNIFFLFFFSLSIQLVLSIVLPISLSADSFAYLRLANNPFMISNWEYRTLGYPLFLKLLFSETFLGLYFVIIFQSISYILVPIILYLSFKKNNKSISFLISIIYSLILSYHWMTNQVMTESLFYLSLSLIVFFLVNFFNNINIKNLNILFFFILVSLLVKPSIQILLYILPIIFFIYVFFNFNKYYLKVLLYCAVGSILLITLYKSVTPKALIYHPLFNLWSFTNVEMCNITDEDQISEIKNNNHYIVPDKNNYLLIKKSYQDLTNNDLTKIYKQKCIQYGNGPKTNEYFNFVAEVINNDKVTFDILTSKYDVRGSPDGPDETLKNIEPLDVVKKIHDKYLFVLPFMHIYWRLTANYGWEKSAKIFEGVLLETISVNDNLLTNKIINFFYKLNPFKTRYVKFKINEGLDMYYWRFIPIPQKSINEQGLKHWYDFHPNIYLQNISTLEKLAGLNIDNIYDSLKPWEEIEKYSDSYYDNFINLSLNKNIGLFFSDTFWRINYFLVIIIKFFIFLILPIYFTIKIIKFSIYNIFNFKDLNKNNNFYVPLACTITFYLTTVISLIFLFQFRQITMHLILVFPILVSFVAELSKIISKYVK